VKGDRILVIFITWAKKLVIAVGASDAIAVILVL